MTINKIGLSALTAAMLTTASMAAGTLTLETGTATKVSQELLSIQVVDANLTTPLVYKNGMIAASATEPGFEIEFPGLNPAGDFTNFLIVDELNATVAENSRLDGTTKIIFDAATNAVILRNAEYRLVSTDNNASMATAGNDGLSLLLPIDTTTVSAELTLWNNNGNPTPIDTANGTIMNAVSQFALTIDTPLSAEIDAAAEFLTFSQHVTNTSTSATTDDLDFSVTNLQQDAGGIWATVTSMDINVTAVTDSNLSNDVQTIAAAGGTGVVSNNTIHYAMTTDDDNSTMNSNTITSSATALTATEFVATGYATVSNGAGAVIPFAANTNAGAWTIYGYNAQIPGASTSAGSTDTVVTVVNTQVKDTAAQNIYFTIIDADANECALDSTMGLASVPTATPGSKNKYRLSSMLADCTNVSGTAYAIEVNVPTTPTDIYSNAFVENVATANGRFKVLPVYNNANSY